MKQGVRTSVLIVDADRLLLVREVDPRTGDEYWIPPGGGLEEPDSTLFAGAQREVFEEAGLLVEIGRLIYLREFWDSIRDTRWLELYFLSDGHESRQPGSQRDVPNDLQRTTRWFNQDELRDVLVYPEILRDDFWKDLHEGFDDVRYLGSSAD